MGLVLHEVESAWKEFLPAAQLGQDRHARLVGAGHTPHTESRAESASEFPRRTALEGLTIIEKKTGVLYQAKGAIRHHLPPPVRATQARRQTS